MKSRISLNNDENTPPTLIENSKIFKFEKENVFKNNNSFNESSKIRNSNQSNLKKNYNNNFFINSDNKSDTYLHDQINYSSNSHKFNSDTIIESNIYNKENNLLNDLNIDKQYIAKYNNLGFISIFKEEYLYNNFLEKSFNEAMKKEFVLKYIISFICLGISGIFFSFIFFKFIENYIFFNFLIIMIIFLKSQFIEGKK